jgi:hypothetical protein
LGDKTRIEEADKREVAYCVDSSLDVRSDTDNFLVAIGLDQICEGIRSCYRVSTEV